MREWLKTLEAADRAVVGQDLMRAQWRWPVGMPLCRALGHGLWEIRSELPSHRTARIVVCWDAGTLVALHAFFKQTQKTPDGVIALARKRQRELKA